MRYAVASLQARQPCGPLRSVRLTGYASAESRLSATVEFWVRRLRLKKWRGVKQSRHALAFGKLAQKEKQHGPIRDVQAKRSKGQELDQMPPLDGVAISIGAASANIC